MGEVAVSAREAEVLDALADRLTNAEIATRLFISVRTVETHVSALLRKLGADNRRALADVARTRRDERAGDEHRGSRLPAQLTSFVGRDEELSAVANTLADARIVTIVGPAGVGKTRLAIEAARRVTIGVDDVALIDLAPTVDGNTALSAVAAALQVPEDPASPLRDSVLRRAADSPRLMVLDNCEHIVDSAAALTADLIDASDRLWVLATSREPLAIPGERLLPLGQLNEAAAVQLFADRAAATTPGFTLDANTSDAVASICTHLDGIPLAIELAAAQVAALTPQQIEVRLRDRFRLLRAPARGRNDRHQALETAVAWSYDLLDPRERALLDRLSVFRGQFSLEAASAVVADPPIGADDAVSLLVQLVRKSLVVAETAGTERRYRLLETMREFGTQRLRDAGELGRWREQHRQWMFSRMREAADGLSCSVVPQWLDTLDDDLDNIEAALDWSMGTPERAAEALPIVRGLERYWMARGRRRAHGVRWSSAAAEHATLVEPAARIEALLGGVLLVMWSDLRAARVLADKARDLAGTTTDSDAQGYAALANAWAELFAGRTDDATTLATRAGTLLHPDNPIHPWCDMALAFVRGFVGDASSAARMAREVAQRFRHNGDDHLFGAWLSVAADYDRACGDERAGREAVERSLHEAKAADCASCLAQALTSAALFDPDPATCLATARNALQLVVDIGEVWGVLCALEVIVGALASEGAVDDAALLAGAISAAREATGMVPLLPGRAAAFTTGVDVARAALGVATFTALERDGATLDYTSAIVHALG